MVILWSLQGAEAYTALREELAEEDILVEWGGTCTRPVRAPRFILLRGNCSEGTSCC